MGYILTMLVLFCALNLVYTYTLRYMQQKHDDETATFIKSLKIPRKVFVAGGATILVCVSLGLLIVRTPLIPGVGIAVLAICYQIYLFMRSYKQRQVQKAEESQPNATAHFLSLITQAIYIIYMVLGLLLVIYYITVLFSGTNSPFYVPVESGQ